MYRGSVGQFASEIATAGSRERFPRGCESRRQAQPLQSPYVFTPGRNIKAYQWRELCDRGNALRDYVHPTGGSP